MTETPKKRGSFCIAHTTAANVRCLSTIFEYFEAGEVELANKEDYQRIKDFIQEHCGREQVENALVVMRDVHRQYDQGDSARPETVDWSGEPPIHLSDPPLQKRCRGCQHKVDLEFGCPECNTKYCARCASKMLSSICCSRNLRPLVKEYRDDTNTTDRSDG